MLQTLILKIEKGAQNRDMYLLGQRDLAVYPRDDDGVEVLACFV